MYGDNSFYYITEVQRGDIELRLLKWINIEA